MFLRYQVLIQLVYFISDVLYTIIQLFLYHHFLQHGSIVLESYNTIGYILKISSDIIYIRDLYIVIADTSGTGSNSLGLFFKGLDIDKVSKTKESKVASNSTIQLSLRVVVTSYKNLQASQQVMVQLAFNKVTNYIFKVAFDRTKVKVAREDGIIAIAVIEILYKLGNLIDKNLVAFILTIQAGDYLFRYIDVSFVLSIVKKEIDRLASILLDIKSDVVGQVNVYLVFRA